MARMIRLYFAIFAFQILLISATTVSFAQVDPTKALIGTWDGQVEANLSNGNRRTIIINSVTAKGEGEWIAKGRFGVTDQVKAGPGGQDMSVLSKDNDVFVEFTTGGGVNNPVRLKLVGDNKLEGTLHTAELGQKRPSDKRFKLEKVAPKAGDVK